MTIMAKTMVVTDDLDGSSGARTVAFSYDGKAFEIDLSKKNATALEKLLKPYIDAARPSGSAIRRGGPAASPRRGRPRRSSATVDLAAVRAWAAEAGVQVADRGRISASVLEQYAAAQAS
jgi:hypothetical protein